MSNSETRVRYGRTDVTRVVRATKLTPSHTVTERVPKNTLSTVRRGDIIYFGIARCNSLLDRFNRDTGKLIASNRAVLAASEGGLTDGFELHNSGLRGSVGVQNIKLLLQYFDNVDDVMRPEYVRTAEVA